MDTNDKWFPLWAVRMAATWLAIGALAKLFLGTPALLPELIRDHSPFEIVTTYVLAIAIELAIVILALLKPARAWLPILLLFAFFDVVLTTQLRAGKESCGCFGGSIKVAPQLMMAIDSALLALLLVSRPWSGLRRPGSSWLAVLLAIACGFGATAYHIKSRTSVERVHTGEPPPINTMVVLHPSSWVGQSIYDIKELTDWVAADKLPTDGAIVLWRQGCDHCATHLREMAARDKGEQPIVLIQIQDDLKTSRAVDAMPKGAHVTEFATPANLEFVMQTPCEVHVVGGVVTEALDEEHFKAKQDESK